MFMNADDPLRIEHFSVHDVYDKIADHFSSTRYKPWPEVTKYLNSLPIGSIGIDLGCGNGKNMVTNRKFFIGTDRCQALLKHAISNEKTKLGDLVRACMLTPVLRPGSMDFCLSIATIHHLASEHRRIESLVEITRLLRTGGTALVFIWASTEKNSINNEKITEFKDNDTLISWNAPDGSTYRRYYHLFKKDELENLIRNNIPELSIINSGWDADSSSMIQDEAKLNYYEVSTKEPHYIKRVDGIIQPSLGGGKTFRSRKIDFGKELNVLLEAAEPEEHLIQMRSVPLLSTGVDKEEEDEAHLKAILSTAPTFSRMGGEASRIPVPDSTQGEDAISAELYSQLYPPMGDTFKKDERWKAPLQQRILDPINNPFYSNHGPSGLYCQNNLLGFGFGSRSPMVLLPLEKKRKNDSFIPYWATGDDFAFMSKLSNNINISTFEKIMWILESVALVYGPDTISNNFLSSKQASVFADRWLNSTELKLMSPYQCQIYDHWKKRKEKFSSNLNIPLIPTLKHEDNLSKSNTSNTIDPYVCFRRRDMRAPRKTRRADMDALLKLSRLQEHFEDLLAVLRLTLQRDQLKKSLLLENGLIFGHSFILEIFKSKYGMDIPPLVIPEAHHQNNHTQSSMSSRTKKMKRNSYAEILTRAEYDGPPALFMNIPSHSYARVAYFMNLVKIQNEFLKNPLPFENISPWKKLIDPGNVCTEITTQLTEIEMKLEMYHQKQQFIPDKVQKQTMLSRERFETILNNNSSDGVEYQQDKLHRPVAYRVGRGGRLVSIPKCGM